MWGPWGCVVLPGGAGGDGPLSLLMAAAIPRLAPALSLGPLTAPWPLQTHLGAGKSSTKQGLQDSVAGESPGTVATSWAKEEQREPGLGGRVVTTCSPSRQGWAWREGASGALCWPGGSGRKEVAAAGPRSAAPPPAPKVWLGVCAGGDLCAHVCSECANIRSCLRVRVCERVCVCTCLWMCLWAPACCVYVCAYLCLSACIGVCAGVCLNLCLYLPVCADACVSASVLV